MEKIMTFVLQSENRSSAVVKTHGGELVSYIRDGQEYVWQGNPEYWSGQAPILFPVVCSPKDGKMAFDGVDYPMPKHGFTNRMEFVPVYISKSRITLELRESAETLAMFPFKFSLTVTYTLKNDGFDAEFAVKNMDKKEMTFCIGGHPGFNCPMEDGESFTDYSLVFDNAEGATVSITDQGFMNDAVPKCDKLNGTNEIPLVYSDFDNDAMIVENLPSRVVRLVSRKTGHGIVFDFDGFDALGLWTPDHKEAPFLCLEPWNGLPAAVTETAEAKDKKYAITLAPGKTYTVGYRTRVI